MTAVEFSAFLVLATAMSFTPGPNTTMAAAMGANWGLKPAMRFVWGVPIGWGALLLLCASGVGALVMAAPALKGAIKAVGIVYLVWLAYKLSRSGQLAETKNGHLLGFWQAVGLQFVNVKAWLLALAIVAGWIVGFQDPMARLIIVLPVMLFYAFASNLLYASVGALLRSWLAQGQRLLWFNRVMALILVLTAVWMLKASTHDETQPPQPPWQRQAKPNRQAQEQACPCKEPCRPKACQQLPPAVCHPRRPATATLETQRWPCPAPTPARALSPWLYAKEMRK